ncbi:MAG: hypothetical protein K8S25_00955 [Alphaproteobacteria bacterium]|nr:hypothetical protein [Alphaproteobacteria bacterium]
MADKAKVNDTERETRFREACALQEIENNPLTPEEIAMFEMFRREGWSDDRVLEFLGTRARKQASDLAAE